MLLVGVIPNYSINSLYSVLGMSLTSSLFVLFDYPFLGGMP